MDKNIKEAFNKVRNDINFLNNEINNIKIMLNKLISDISAIPTLQQINPTNSAIPTHNPTHPLEIEGLKTINLGISTGNEGDPTDRQTDRQTDNPTHNLIKNIQKNTKNEDFSDFSIEDNLKEANDILNSLDSIKKEIRLKFKHLTNQEMLVFSLIYQLEEQNIKDINYKLLSKNLNLSESSIRDYIQRIINKGIPIKKKKINNKTIFLSISPELKKIASLNTIIRLREL